MVSIALTALANLFSGGPFFLAKVSLPPSKEYIMAFVYCTGAGVASKDPRRHQLCVCKVHPFGTSFHHKSILAFKQPDILGNLPDFCDWMQPS